MGKQEDYVLLSLEENGFHFLAFENTMKQKIAALQKNFTLLVKYFKTCLMCIKSSSGNLREFIDM